MVPPTAAILLYFAFSSSGLEYLESPSLSHPLGTDEFGRDSLAVLFGSTVLSLLRGCGFAASAFFIAGLLVYLTAMRGSIIASAVLRSVTQVIDTIPNILWVLVIVVTLPQPKYLMSLIAFSLAALPIISNAMSGEIERLQQSDFVRASRALGAHDMHVLFRHMIPNSMPILLPLFVNVLGAAIAVYGGIGVLGFGNRSELDLGILMLRARESFLSQPHLLPICILMYVLLYLYLRFCVNVMRKGS